MKNSNLKSNILRLHPWLDKDNKFMIFSNCKCASTSLIYVFEGKVERFRTLGSEKYEARLNSFNIEETFKCTVVRNPWARVVSAYHFLYNHENSYIPSDVDFSCFVEDILPKISLYETEEFRTKLVSYPEEITKEEFIAHHLQYQYEKVECVDFTARLENIQEDWEIIKENTGANKKLLRKRQSKRENYRLYYNGSTREIVSKLYAKDIEVLSYVF